ncbi:hypothetical protein [Nocardia thraciensis]
MTSGGQAEAPADPRLEATRLVMLVNGLGTSVLAGQRTVDYAARCNTINSTESSTPPTPESWTDR